MSASTAAAPANVSHRHTAWRPHWLPAARLLRRPAVSFPRFPIYNRFALADRHHRRWPLFAALLFCVLWLASCVAPLGPGYTIEKQEIDVHFLSGPEPRTQVEVQYALRNTGNQSVHDLEMRLPGRRFNLVSKRFLWDNTELTPVPRSWNPRVSVVHLPEAWKIAERHSVRISFEIAPAEGPSSGPAFASDAFFLAADNWSPELLPSEGLFGFGGVPPPQWMLTVRVPRDFLVHASGSKTSTASSGDEQGFRALQTAKDRAPFVVAARYTSSQMGDGKQPIYLWTRSPQQLPSLKAAGDQIARTMDLYNQTFGAHAVTGAPLWIVECPVSSNCFRNLNPRTEMLLGGSPSSAEMVSADTVVIDVTAGIPKLGAAVAPSLAAKWLGYGQNPAFYEQTPPLSALPLFAAALGRESIEGPQYRTETIQRALRLIPKTADHHPANPPRKLQESPDVIRAKSFLFFYGLQDRFGKEAVSRALSEMLAARRGRGFNLNDLIAVLWDDTHQNPAEFTRLWMKRPGVPEEFRARYDGASALAAISKENER